MPTLRLQHTLVLASLALLSAGACNKGSDGAPQPAAGQTAAAAAAIVIGHVASITGTEATFGISSDKGIRLLFDEINGKGGIKGRLIKLVTLDDQGKPEEAATATTRLIASDHVTALLGEVASTRSLFMAPKAQLAKVPMVTPSSTNKKVTAVGDYIFRACFIDPFQGYVMAKFARENLKLSKIAILKDVRNDYSVGLAQVFDAEFTKMGGTIVATESFNQGDVDFKAQLAKIKSAAPEAIYEPGYYTDTGLIARQAREAGLTVPLLGGDGWDSDKLYEIGGAALEGSYFSNHYSVDDPSPRIQAFVQRYKTIHGVVPDGLAAQAYDAAGMLADAMQRAADLTGPAIRDALAATKGYPGVTGDITLDAERNPLKPAVILKVAKGGKYEFVARILPETAAAPAPAAAPGNAPAPALAPAK
jgi:branched-chain amino acid transport system substrate-binding protein